MKLWKVIPLSLFAMLSVSSIAKAFEAPPTIPLQCGKIPKFNSEAEREYLDAASGGGDTYTIKLRVFGKKPNNKQLDTALRDCLAVAVKKDGSKDILATAWYKESIDDDSSESEMLRPYGAGVYCL